MTKPRLSLFSARSVSASALLLLLGTLAAPAFADGPVMFGHDAHRNMADPTAKGLPSDWDVKTGKNVLWSQPVGSQSYSGPVISGGKVFIGTNNEGLRNPALTKDRGVVMAFDAKTGEFLWQMTHEKLPESKLHDWPLQGVCSTPAVEGDRIYYVSNRAEVVALDTEGFRDGENDGPFTDEEATSEIDGDVVWKFDLMGELDVFPHNLAAGSPLIVGNLIYASTGTGVDEAHISVPVPYAPSIVALDKTTGKLVWEDHSPGEHTMHGTWSNPSYAEFGGKPTVVFPAGDGWIYGFEPATGEIRWKFNANPEGSVWRLGGAGTKNNVIGMGAIDDGMIYVGVGQDPEHGEAPGNYWAFAPGDKTGDITKSALVWHRGGADFNRTISTASIQDGIVYISDLSGFLYALDAKTGEHYWTYDAFAAIWGSPSLADGKIYLGDEDGDVAVLKAGKGKDGEPELIGEHNMGAAVYTTPVGKDGVLYIEARNRLWALENGASTPPEAAHK